MSVKKKKKTRGNRILREERKEKRTFTQSRQFTLASCRTPYVRARKLIYRRVCILKRNPRSTEQNVFSQSEKGREGDKKKKQKKKKMK